MLELPGILYKPVPFPEFFLYVLKADFEKLYPSNGNVFMIRFACLSYLLSLFRACQRAVQLKLPVDLVLHPVSWLTARLATSP